MAWCRSAYTSAATIPTMKVAQVSAALQKAQVATIPLSVPLMVSSRLQAPGGRVTRKVTSVARPELTPPMTVLMTARCTMSRSSCVATAALVPPLNARKPNMSMKAPSAAWDTECPAMFCAAGRPGVSNLPILGPRNTAPMSAQTPPR